MVAGGAAWRSLDRLDNPSSGVDAATSEAVIDGNRHHTTVHQMKTRLREVTHAAREEFTRNLLSAF